MNAVGLFLAFQLWILAVGIAAYTCDRRRHLSPGTWLAAVALSLAPLAIPTLARGIDLFLARRVNIELSTSLTEAIPVIFTTPATETAEGSPTEILFTVYVLIVIGLGVVTLARFAGLHRAAAAGERVEQDIVLVEASQPPLALGAPTHAVVISVDDWQALGAEDRARLLAHERVHLHHRDPGMRLLLALFAHAFWINPGARALVDGWVQSAELRADRAAAAADPKAYARLFASLSRPQFRTPLPAPTFPAPKRRTAMRVSQILAPTPPRRLAGPLVGTAALLALLGGAGLAVAQTDDFTVKIPEAEVHQFKADGLMRRNFTTAEVVEACGEDETPVSMVVIKGWIDTSGGLSNLQTELASSDCLERLAYDQVAELNASHFDIDMSQYEQKPADVLMMFLHADESAETRSVRKIKGTIKLDADALDFGGADSDIVSEKRVMVLKTPEGTEGLESLEQIEKIIVKELTADSEVEPRP